MTGGAEQEHGGRANWRVVGWGAAVLLLLLPFFAMRVTDEVNWTTGDFFFAAVLIGGVGLTFELAVRKAQDWRYRLATAIALAAAFLLTWANGAVGIIGSETNDANALFGLVPLAAVLGAAFARLRPAAMGNAMLATAAVQLLVTVAVLAISWTEREPIWPREFLYSAGGFGGLWLSSAWLFRQASRRS